MTDPLIEPSAQFPRAFRLVTAKHYKQVFTKPVKASSRNFTLLAVANDLSYPRLGLIVAKKHVKRAVDRNRIKRVIRQSFRTYNQQHNQSLPSIDLVILVRGASSQQMNKVLFEQLERLWQKIGKKCAGS